MLPLLFYATSPADGIFPTISRISDFLFFQWDFKKGRSDVYCTYMGLSFGHFCVGGILGSALVPTANMLALHLTAALSTAQKEFPTENCFELSRVLKNKTIGSTRKLLKSSTPHSPGGISYCKLVELKMLDFSEPARTGSLFAHNVSCKKLLPLVLSVISRRHQTH